MAGVENLTAHDNFLYHPSAPPKEEKDRELNTEQYSTCKEWLLSRKWLSLRVASDRTAVTYPESHGIIKAINVLPLFTQGAAGIEDRVVCAHLRLYADDAEW